MKDLESENANLTILVERIRRKLEDTDNYTKAVDSMNRKKTEITEFQQVVMLKLHEIEMTISEELQTIEALINGIFHHNLVNLELLVNKHNELMTEPGNDYLLLRSVPYPLIRVDSLTLDGKLYVKLIVPMPKNKIFQLKKLYPIISPFAEGWGMTVNLETNWIAIDKHDGRHIMWKDDEKKCKKSPWKNDTYINICESNGIEYQNDASLCLEHQLNHGSTNEEICDKSLVRMPTLWVVKLTKENSWIYSATTSLRIKAICKGKSEPMWLTMNGAGLLNVLKPCDLVYGNVKLMYSRELRSNLTEIGTVIDTVKIPHMPSWAEEMKTIEKLTKSAVPVVKVNTHRELSKSIERAVQETNDLKDQWEKENLNRMNEESIEKFKSQSQSLWAGLGGILLAVALGLVALICIWKYKMIMISTLTTLINMGVPEVDAGERREAANGTLNP